MRTYKEPVRELPIIREVDVVVVGGGVSGIAAAIAAARAGASTILVEKSPRLGGVATSSLMTGMGNLFVKQDGRLIVKGVALDLINRTMEYGGWMPGWLHPNVGNIGFEPEAFEQACIDLLDAAGVETFLSTISSDVIMEGNAVKGLIIESVWSRDAVLCKAMVDASGESNMLMKAGAEHTLYPEGFFQVHGHNNHGTMLFRMGDVDIDKFVDYIVEENQYPEGYDGWLKTEQFRENWYERGLIFFPHGGAGFMKIFQDAIKDGRFNPEHGRFKHLAHMGLYGIKGHPVAVNSHFYYFNEPLLTTANMSRVNIEARAACRYVADFLIANVPGFENAKLVQTGNEFGIRLARMLDTGNPYTEEEKNSGAKFADTIGLVPVRTEDKKGLVSDMPLRMTIPKEVEGILAGSGKNIDARPNGLIRGMSRCMTVGQGTGVAAAISARLGVNVRDVPVLEIQKELVAQGAYLGEPERLKELGVL